MENGRILMRGSLRSVWWIESRRKPAGKDIIPVLKPGIFGAIQCES